MFCKLCLLQNSKFCIPTYFTMWSTIASSLFWPQHIFYNVFVDHGKISGGFQIIHNLNKHSIFTSWCLQCNQLLLKRFYFDQFQVKNYCRAMLLCKIKLLIHRIWDPNKTQTLYQLNKHMINVKKIWLTATLFRLLLKLQRCADRVLEDQVALFTRFQVDRPPQIFTIVQPDILISRFGLAQQRFD